MLRLRIPELMAAAGLATGYQLAKRSGGRISPTTAYRLVDNGGKVESIDLRVLEGLLAAFEIDAKDMGKLFASEGTGRGRRT